MKNLKSLRLALLIAFAVACAPFTPALAQPAPPAAGPPNTFGSVAAAAADLNQAAGTGLTTALDARFAKTAQLYVKTVSGLTATWVVKLQQSPDGTNWYDVASATAAAAATPVVSVPQLTNGKYVRAAVGTDAGGAAVATVTVLVK